MLATTAQRTQQPNTTYTIVMGDVCWIVNEVYLVDHLNELFLPQEGYGSLERDKIEMLHLLCA